MKPGKVLIAIILGCFLVAAFVFGLQPLSAQESGAVLNVWIEPSGAEVLPLEPLFIVVHLKNKAGHRVAVTESWELFRYRYSGTGQWDIYYPKKVPKVTVLPLTTRIFQPDEMQTQPSYFDFQADAEGKHVFAQPGTVWLTVGIGRLKSAPVPVTVVEPQGVDLEAYEFLRQTELTQYFAHESFKRYPYDEQTVSSLERFSQEFPGSRYSEHAQLALALMWMHGVEGKPDMSRATGLLIDLSKRASGNVAARAYYYLVLQW